MKQINIPHNPLLAVLLCLALTAMNCFGADTETPVNKAVLKTSKDLGFSLSDIARKTIGITTTPIESVGSHLVADAGMVRHLDKIGVYRLRDGWFKLLDVKILQQTPAGFVVSTSDLTKGDELVVQGVALLRVAEMEAFSDGE